jgi:hypothetical protein
VADPLTLGQLQHLSPPKATPGRQVEVLHRGWKREVGRPDTAQQAIVGAARGLDVQQQAEALFKGKVSIVGTVQLLFQRRPETGQAELAQFVE